MLEHLKAEDRFHVRLSYAYRIVGRIALIAAFVLALGSELRGAVASLAIALWMMWSTTVLHIAMVGKAVDALGESQKL
jgi:hypothetical protein